MEKRSKSFPENLSEIKQREYEQKHNELSVALQHFKEKDHHRTERLATIGSDSSLHLQRELTYGQRCCELFIRWGNYVMERSEESSREDFRIRQKSYAGFYYFIKWFARSVFVSLFTIAGSIGGKEIGCAIKEHKTCTITALDLAGNSPHIVSSVLGFIFGLLVGQWIGRFVWDHLTRQVLRCLRKLEKHADRTKLWLLITSLFVYIIGSGIFATIFWFFVKIDGVRDNIIGGIVGGTIGLICAGLAYRKSSSCMSGQQTPGVNPSENGIDVPEIIL